jgi:hypothetical protein
MPAKKYGLMAGVMSGSTKDSGVQVGAKEHVTPAKKRSAFAKNLKKFKKEK